MNSKKIFYIATFGGGVFERICHRSKTEVGARKALEKCEARGGSKHNLYRATLLPRIRP